MTTPMPDSHSSTSRAIHPVNSAHANLSQKFSSGVYLIARTGSNDATER